MEPGTVSSLVLKNTGVLLKTCKLQNQHHATIAPVGINRPKLAWLWSPVQEPGEKLAAPGEKTLKGTELSVIGRRLLPLGRTSDNVQFCLGRVWK